MKTKLLFLAGFFIAFSASSQLQKNVGVNQKNFHNVNAEPISIGAANDVISASNLYDASMGGVELILKRIDASGAIVWMETYANTTIGRARVFDITTHLDLIFVAGSIEDTGINRSFIAVVDGINGNLLNAEIFDVVSPNFHSTPLKIMYTESDATGNSTPDPGLVVTGFFSSCAPINVSCGLNAGFVLRTDLSLNILWSIELESIVTSSLDYDFINGIVETSDGYLLTGSVTGQSTLPGIFQQGVLAHKIDFLGVSQWDSSYLFGNSNDVSVDGYFDNGSNEIYMLTNYSSSHHFGITVLNNATGTIVPIKSWSATSPFLDYYGFKLLRSASSANNLVIQGYNRDNTVTGTLDQTNPFIYEFDMATGNQVGDSYQYLLPHTEPVGEVFNFWNGQMPLIYYPDMGLLYIDTAGNASYALGGYRTDATGFTNIEFFVTPLNKLNQCDQENLNFTVSALTTLTPITTVSTGNTPVLPVALALTNTSVTYNEDSCDPLSVGSNEYKEIKMYPNPASERIFITGENIQSIQVVDIGGSIIIEQTDYYNAGGLYVGNLKNGVYFVSVTGVNNQTQTLKLIKK